MPINTTQLNSSALEVRALNRFEMNLTLFILVFWVYMLKFVCCFKCVESELYESVSYTTEDTTVLSQIAYISEFKVRCRSPYRKLGNLYALFKEKIIPVANVAPNMYQISWTEELKNAKVGVISIKIFNEMENYLLKMRIRNGEYLDISLLSFLKIKMNKTVSFSGPCISCEFLASIFSLFIAYYAIHLRMKFVS
ncbi:hypothetical protein WA026_020485 [Henosepilachna vigintioctopunctata]|uniref:Translocon-associated protein subunit delta n=1 Tax=Henosepilachna vigintioctopunctata TaxID=420089 RepID=A0AAW1VCQ1_9CUCU